MRKFEIIFAMFVKKGFYFFFNFSFTKLKFLRFFQKADLTKHMSIHNNNLFFECQSCDKKYRWEKQLKQHAKSHEKVYFL